MQNYGMYEIATWENIHVLSNCCISSNLIFQANNRMAYVYQCRLHLVDCNRELRDDSVVIMSCHSFNIFLNFPINLPLCKCISYIFQIRYSWKSFETNFSHKMKHLHELLSTQPFVSYQIVMRKRVHQSDRKRKESSVKFGCHRKHTFEVS